jgi:hypothetical protein
MHAPAAVSINSQDGNTQIENKLEQECMQVQLHSAMRPFIRHQTVA